MRIYSLGRVKPSSWPDPASRPYVRHPWPRLCITTPSHPFYLLYVVCPGTQCTHLLYVILSYSTCSCVASYPCYPCCITFSRWIKASAECPKCKRKCTKLPTLGFRYAPQPEIPGLTHCNRTGRLHISLEPLPPKPFEPDQVKWPHWTANAVAVSRTLSLTES